MIVFIFVYIWHLCFLECKEGLVLGPWEEVEELWCSGHVAFRDTGAGSVGALDGE